MKSHLRNHITAAFLLIPSAAALVAAPALVQAATPAPEVNSLEVSSDRDLGPGSELRFRVEGTPRGQASVRIRGTQSNIALREVRPGFYVGRYTIKRSDRIDDNSQIRASIRSGNRTAVASYPMPDDLTRDRVAQRPPQPVPPVPVPVPVLKIERFTVTPIDRLEPGAELKFALVGAPGARAEFDIPGVADNVAMREVRPGVYEGSYTIRRMDNLSPSRPIVATLRMGDRTVTEALHQPLIADARPPTIRHVSPREGEAVLGRNATVSGVFDDAGGLGVDPRSVRITVSGRNVTAQSEITPQHFTYRADLPPGRHSVEVAASDMAGNSVRRSWNFDVAASVSSVPTTIPLQVTSHANNGSVGQGATVIHGRTAPNAMVDIRVTAAASVVGLFGVTQEISTQHVQADREGRFEFSFTPKLPLPGTRYEVTMTSQRGDLRAESTLVLFQRQG